jgi:hypothetical protein
MMNFWKWILEPCCMANVGLYFDVMASENALYAGTIESGERE